MGSEVESKMFVSVVVTSEPKYGGGGLLRFLVGLNRGGQGWGGLSQGGLGL